MLTTHRENPLAPTLREQLNQTVNAFVEDAIAGAAVARLEIIAAAGADQRGPVRTGVAVGRTLARLHCAEQSGPTSAE